MKLTALRSRFDGEGGSVQRLYGRRERGRVKMNERHVGRHSRVAVTGVDTGSRQSEIGREQTTAGWRETELRWQFRCGADRLGRVYPGFKYDDSKMDERHIGKRHPNNDSGTSKHATVNSARF